MANLFCIYDTFSGDIVFHDSEEEANEDYQTVIEIVESLEVKGHEVFMFELKRKMKMI